MLNISGIQEGFVLDHIKAGMSLSIYHYLKLDQLTAVSRSSKMRAAKKWEKRT